VIVQQRIFGLQPNTTYVLSAWADAADGGEVRLGAKYFGSQDVWTSDMDRGYRQISLKFATGAHNTTATVYCSKVSGVNSAYFDDLQIAPTNN
jgi:hypothetical protein